MPTVKVRNLKNEEVGDLDLSDAVFGAELNEGLIHTAVKAHMANARQGTVGTKTRGDVSGSGRKLWKQKGTGRARVASIRSPLWKGGGNVHGPQARDWSQNLPKKMRRGALRSALSERLREGNLIVVEGFEFAQAKTKEFVGTLGTLGLDGKTLIVDKLDNENLILSSRNLKNVKIVGAGGLNVYDVLYHEKLVLSREAIQEVERQLEPGTRSSRAEGAATEENSETTETLAGESATEEAA